MTPTVLIVTPTWEDVAFYNVILEKLGYGVLNVHTPDQALETALQNRPRVVVTELIEPTSTGWRTPELLRKHPQTRHVPIVAVTALSMPEETERARSAGCDLVMIKPVSPRDLVITIQELVR